MTTNEFLKKTNVTIKMSGGYKMQMIRNKIVCKDGFTMSVQASEHHYCTPRVNGLDAYEEVEVGFPSMKEELLMEYAEDPSNPTDTVYGYVPVEIVDEIIKKHGIDDANMTHEICEFLKECIEEQCSMM